jgi:serine protease
LQWNLPLIDMERAWDIQPAAGSNIVVAVLDTGVAYSNQTLHVHASAFRDDQGTLYPALGDLTLNFAAAPELAPFTRFVSPHDFIWDDNVPLDFDGHGTHVSGTIGQLTNNGAGVAGVAFNVKIMPVKVIDSIWDDVFGAPNFGTDDVVARGIRYAADNGAKIINMSIGRDGDPAPVIEDAIKYAVGKGVFIAIAGGNSFEDGNPKEVVADIASRVQGAVSVAAVGPDKTHAHYSTTGNYIELSAPGGTDRGFGRNGYVFQQTYDFTATDTFLLPPAQFAAPRFDVINYVGYVGTSQATPHVSGVAAMLMQQGITDPAAIEAALEKFATDLGDPGRDNTYGYGLIEARDTLRGLGLAK